MTSSLHTPLNQKLGIDQTGSVEEARRAAEAGVDAVIAQGVEAGGHVRAKESLWDVLPRVVEAVKPLPVLASGGIGDGAGIARALGLGAQGVSLGTRFVASEEAWVHRARKERIVSRRGDDSARDHLRRGLARCAPSCPAKQDRPRMGGGRQAAPRQPRR